MIIEESGMRFGDYPEEAVFYVEKSEQYNKHLRPQGVKCCEFILKRGRDILFLEAKTSSPRALQANSPAEKKAKYQAYVQDIILKMRHTLALYASILFRRYEATGVPAKLLETNLALKRIKLILVVRKAEAMWLIPLMDKLRREMNIDLQIMKPAELFVLNEEKARAKHLLL